MDQTKEETVIILDFLPHGYPFDSRPMHQKTPIAQALGKEHFSLLELVPKKGVHLQPHEKVYIGEGKRDQIHHVLGKLSLDKLTQTARVELNDIITDQIKEKEARFVEFFNKAEPINTRRHQIELLPGIGKKHMWEILETRRDKPFTSFEDIKKRVKLIPDPEKLIVKRILAELNNEDKYKLFVGN
ncbi:MAG: DNA-binding protein [Nanoarchaeota archaeon]|jgi:putative nucleotide binding protein|nr:DNA-binding protein [Nanoarchaeota archaeon]|tara:strand:- start:41044 stop:41601 length:558 start_codon:yes stop_codon:yes gene_type:complete